MVIKALLIALLITGCYQLACGAKTANYACPETTSDDDSLVIFGYVVEHDNVTGTVRFQTLEVLKGRNSLDIEQSEIEGRLIESFTSKCHTPKVDEALIVHLNEEKVITRIAFPSSSQGTGKTYHREMN